MSTGQFEQTINPPLFLHPSVGTWADPAKLNRRQRVAAVAKVRCLEHDLFDGDRINRSLSSYAAEGLAAQINELRRALGWLEIDLDAERASHQRRQIAAQQ